MNIGALLAGLAAAGGTLIAGGRPAAAVRVRRVSSMLGPATGATRPVAWRLAVPRRPAAGCLDLVDVADLALQLAGLLRAGLPTRRAWQALAGASGPAQGLCAAVTTQLAAGGQVAEALRAQHRPQALRWLAVACDVADRGGSPLADVLNGFVAGVRADQQAAADLEAAMAGPRATSRVLCALPVAGVGLGCLLGADPLHVLVATGPGRGVLAIGLGLWAGGLWWIRELVRRVEKSGETAARAEP